jgi:uncharacterized SAM-binding protein YcdF (DUF218 family)
MARAIVILGAAVRPDGAASPTLRRRAIHGAKLAEQNPQDWVFCSGGVGRYGPSEASIIADILRDRGVAASRIALDEISIDTLQNVVEAARFVRRCDLVGVVACSDGYHLPRVKMLFQMLGVSCSTPSMPPELAGGRAVYGLGMQAREWAAYPYDLAVVIRRRRALMAAIASEDVSVTGRSL